MKIQLKQRWEYSLMEIKAMILLLISQYEDKKKNNPEWDGTDMLHKFNYRIPFSLNDGFAEHKLEMLEWEEEEFEKGKMVKKPLYGLYLVAIQKDGLGPGKDWESTEPVTKFFNIKEFDNDRMIKDLYNHFQRAKKFKEDLAARKI